MRTKLNDLRCALSVKAIEFDIIILVETWLNDSISDLVLGFNNYNIFRLDRNSVNSNFSRGDGVLIAIRNCLCSRALNISVSSVEQLFVDIQLDGKHLIIGTVYIPPASGVYIYEKSLSGN